MKYILKFTLISLFLFFISCETTEDVEMDRTTKPTVNVVNSNVVISEGESATLEIETPNRVNKKLSFKLVQVGGDATFGESFNFSQESTVEYGQIGGLVEIEPYSTSASVTLFTYPSYFIDHDETIDLELQSIIGMNGLAGSKNISVTITSLLPEKLMGQVAWNKDFENTDLDLILIDSNDNLMAYLGSSNNPELGELLELIDADGTYRLLMDPYWVEDGIKKFDLQWSFAEPNGDITVIDQLYDYENRETVYEQLFGLDYLITIEKTGDDFVITANF